MTLNTKNKIGAWMMGGAVLVTVSGCDPLTVWDHEYACRGYEEQSVVLPDAVPSMAKSVPMEIDFHLRGSRVMFKTHTAQVSSLRQVQLTFDAKEGAHWLHGSFDKDTHELMFYEQSELKTPLGVQTERVSGRFKCNPV